MTQTVSQNDILAKVALEDALGIVICQPYVGITVSDEAGLVAAFAFNGFDRISVDITAIVVKPLAISAARAIADYVFRRLGVRRVTATTLATNDRAINRLYRLGFECEGRLKERFAQGDALIFGLLASKQKLLRSHEQSEPPRSGRHCERANELQ